MRDTNRLDTFYDELKTIHKNAFPDMREAQFLLNLLGWINTNKRDPFFIETQEFLKYANEYAKNNSCAYLGWSVLTDEQNK